MLFSCRLCLIASTIALITLAACSTPILTTSRVSAYTGPLRSIDDVGVFLQDQSVMLTKVDDVDLSTFRRTDGALTISGSEIELLPGTHSLEFRYLLEVPVYTIRSSSPTIKVVEVEAGHVYMPTYVVQPNSRWDVKIEDVTAFEHAKLTARRSAISAN